jgi:hypothetical protein
MAPDQWTPELEALETQAITEALTRISRRLDAGQRVTPDEFAQLRERAVAGLARSTIRIAQRRP